ncbi:IS701 family transposase [Nocardiopsis rhodophaea]
MQAPLLDIPPTVTDQERAHEWADELENLLAEAGRIFPRADLRRRAAACVRGLLAALSRKNGWQLAEHAGDATPHGQQHLLSRARWDPDELRDFVRRYAVQGLDDDPACGLGPDGAGVLVLDETGFAKKGRTSAGVARQFTGCLGGVFGCQVGVLAAWATTRGHALIDRELYLPKEWTDDPRRCQAAHVPEGTGFATKPRLAERMIERILPDLPEGRVWIAADEVYGRDGRFRAFLEAHRLPYAVTVQANQTVLPRPGWRHIARLVERTAAEQDWAELPAGPSQLDSRAWQWWVRRVPDPDTEVGGGAWARWIIARRRPDNPAERDYFLAWGPEETPVEELVGVPGARWRVEEAIRLATSACGLADYEVRSYGGWYRHVSLVMLAAAFLTVQDARAVSGTTGPAAPPGQRGGGA